MMLQHLASEESPPPLPAYFTWGMARDVGLTRAALKKLVEQHQVRRVFTDVYVRRDVPDTLDSRLEAARLILPPHAVVVDRTAAWLWGVDAFDLWELDFVPKVDAYVLRGQKRITREDLGGGTRDLQPRDVHDWRGTLVTTPLRTALDLACQLPRYSALATVDALARDHDLEVGQLESELRRFRRRRGVVQARALVAFVNPLTESTGESFTRLAIIESGLPTPKAQVWVEVDGIPLYRLDLAYELLKICIEYDGKQHHSSPEDKEADRRRRRWLRGHGWHVIVVDKDSFSGGPAIAGWQS